MKIFRNALAGGVILTIPALVGLPAPYAPNTPAIESAALPRDVLLARLAEALETAGGMKSAAGLSTRIGLIPALAVVGALLLLLVWLVLRRRSVDKPARAPRDSRATVALDLIRGGATPGEAMVRAHVSRDAIELLVHTTMGRSFT